MRLKGKRAAITGGGSGLGQRIAFEFAHQGAKVAVIDKNLDTAQTTVNSILKEGGKALAFKGDVSRSEDVQYFLGDINNKFEGIDILVNVAGVTGRSLGDGPVGECTEEAWDTITSINLKGTFLCCKYGVQLMQPKENGVIINMSSILGMVGCQDYFKSHAYQTTKAGIIGLTRSIATYYAKYGIRANTLAPGLIETKATEKVKQNEEVLAFTRQMQPLGELGSPVEVARAAVFLASEESSFITGQVIAVDGGWSAQ